MEDSMRAMLAAMALVASIGLVSSQNAGAVPMSAHVKEAAAAASLLQHAQYREGYTRHGIVKCYRTLVFGRYRCHYYHRRWW
jgi:hypothetical protein